MEENRQDANGTNKPYCKQPCLIKGASQRSPIGVFILYDLLRNKPTNENTGEERT